MHSIEQLANLFLDRWAKDPAGAMLMVSPDIVYTLNVSRQMLAVGGETTGWPAVNYKMLSLRRLFEYCRYRPQVLGAVGDVVRSRIDMKLRHRPTGEILTFTMRNVMTVRAGMIVRVDEYVDRELIEAFLRLVGAPPQSEATSAPAQPMTWYTSLRRTRPAARSLPRAARAKTATRRRVGSE
jgi:ketosteroid isomerase-like protein